MSYCGIVNENSALVAAHCVGVGPAVKVGRKAAEIESRDPTKLSETVLRPKCYWFMPQRYSAVSYAEKVYFSVSYALLSFLIKCSGTVVKW